MVDTGSVSYIGLQFSVILHSTWAEEKRDMKIKPVTVVEQKSRLT